MQTLRERAGLWMRVRASLLRRWAPAALYLAATACAALAALVPAGAPVRNECILLQDVSASVTRSGRTPLPEFVAQLLDESDLATRFDFAGDAALRDGDTPPAAAALQPGFTDIAAALERAAGLPRPGRTRRRIVVVSDGQENSGDAAAAARELAGAALVETVAAGNVPAPDAQALSLSAPGLAVTGSAFTLTLEASATRSLAAEAVLTENGTVLERRNVTLSPAPAAITFDVTPHALGLREFSCRLLTRGDLVPENDTARAAVLVTGGKRIVWIGDTLPPEWIAPEGFTVETRSPAALPADVGLRYACAVLDDAPGAELPPGAGTTLLQAVRDGLGLLVVGGFHSLGPGGYADGGRLGEPLETVLPVRLEPANGLALVLCLDVSGSMGDPVAETGNKVSKLSLAVTAVLEAVKRLVEGDQVAVVAFSDKVETLLPPTAVERAGEAPAELEKRLLELRSGGGTRMFSATTRALNLLKDVRARRKHVIVVTDGDTEEKDAALENGLKFLELEYKRGAFGMSVIALGDNPNAEMLELLEKRCGAHTVKAAGQLLKLPAVLATALREGREYRESGLAVAEVAPHALTQGFKPTDFSAAAAVVAVGPAKLRGGAIVALSGPRNESLLAAWRVGLGRVAVFAGAPWREWGWGEAKVGRELSRRALAWCAEDTDRKPGLELRLRDGRVEATFAATASPGNLLRAELRAVDYGETPLAATFRLYPAGKGMWRGSCPAPATGSYFVAATDGARQLACAPLLAENRAEYLSFGADGSKLARIAQAGGGDLAAARGQFAPWESIPPRGDDAPPAAHPLFLAAAALLFLLGMAASALR